MVVPEFIFLTFPFKRENDRYTVNSLGFHEGTSELSSGELSVSTLFIHLLRL